MSPPQIFVTSHCSKTIICLRTESKWRCRNHIAGMDFKSLLHPRRSVKRPPPVLGIKVFVRITDADLNSSPPRFHNPRGKREGKSPSSSVRDVRGKLENNILSTEKHRTQRIGGDVSAIECPTDAIDRGILKLLRIQRIRDEP